MRVLRNWIDTSPHLADYRNRSPWLLATALAAAAGGFLVLQEQAGLGWAGLVCCVPFVPGVILVGVALAGCLGGRGG